MLRRRSLLIQLGIWTMLLGCAGPTLAQTTTGQTGAAPSGSTRFSFGKLFFLVYHHYSDWDKVYSEPCRCDRKAAGPVSSQDPLYWPYFDADQKPTSTFYLDAEGQDPRRTLTWFTVATQMAQHPGEDAVYCLQRCICNRSSQSLLNVNWPQLAYQARILPGNSCDCQPILAPLIKRDTGPITYGARADLGIDTRDEVTSQLSLLEVIFSSMRAATTNRILETPTKFQLPNQQVRSASIRPVAYSQGSNDSDDPLVTRSSVFSEGGKLFGVINIRRNTVFSITFINSHTIPIDVQPISDCCSDFFHALHIRWPVHLQPIQDLTFTARVRAQKATFLSMPVKISSNSEDLGVGVIELYAPVARR